MASALSAPAVDGEFFAAPGRRGDDGVCSSRLQSALTYVREHLSAGLSSSQLIPCTQTLFTYTVLLFPIQQEKFTSDAPRFALVPAFEGDVVSDAPLDTRAFFFGTSLRKVSPTYDWTMVKKTCLRKHV